MRKSPPITRGRKFAEVLEGARRVFLREGYEGASVDDIAREAGVSKATLDSYFPDKRLMFIEVFRAELARGRPGPLPLDQSGLPVRQVLPVLVHALAEQMVSDLGVRVFRLGAGEAGRFPALAQEYHDTGALALQRDLAAYLAACARRGELALDDPDLAAAQLVRLAGAAIHDRALFLGPRSVRPRDIQRSVAGAVRVFLCAYATAEDSASHDAGGQDAGGQDAGNPGARAVRRGGAAAGLPLTPK